jgi:hypothetical protein
MKQIKEQHFTTSTDKILDRRLKSVCDCHAFKNKEKKIDVDLKQRIPA